MSDNLLFSVRLTAAVEDFNAGMAEARRSATATVSAIDSEIESLTQGTRAADQILQNLFRADPGNLTQALNQTAQELNSLGNGARLSGVQIEQALENATRHTTLLSNDLQEARRRVEELTANGPPPASIVQARAEVTRLETELQQAQTASTNLSNSMQAAMQRSAAATRNAEQEVNRLFNQRTDSQIRNEINDITASLQRMGQRTDISQQELARMTQAGEARLRELHNELNNTSQGADRMASAFSGIQGILASLGIGLTIDELGKMADEFKNVEARVKLSTDSMGQDFKSAFDGISEIALSTFSNFSSTAELFTKINQQAKILNLSQQDVLGVTKTINQAIQVSGASADSANAAITQLAQGLSSGVLRGDEFNSVMEQAPKIADMLAASLKVTKGELRNMAEQGKLTAETVIKAIQGQSEAVNKEFATLPLTIGRSVENLKTSFMMYIGEMDKASGASSEVAKAIQFISQNLDSLVSALLVAAKVAIAYKAIGLATSFYEKAQAASFAAQAVRIEATAVAQNTTAIASNATAARTAASAQTAYGAAAQTAGAQAAAASAGSIGRLSALSTGLMGVVSKLGMVGAYATAAYVAWDLLKKGGEVLGESAAKLVLRLDGTADAIKKSEEAAKSAEVHAKVVADRQKRDAEAQQKALDDLKYKAADSSKEVIKAFDDIIAKGGDVQKALDGIKEKMKFDTPINIQTSIVALTDLEKQGKITGEQVRKSLTESLEKVDLLTFQTNMEAGFGKVQDNIEGTKKKIADLSAALADKDNLSVNKAQEYTAELEKQKTKLSELERENQNYAHNMEVAHDAIIGQALERTGVSINILKNQIGDASRQNANDIYILTQNFDELKSKGVDASLALASSLKQAIKEADNPQALQMLQGKIEDLKGKLGEPYTQGLMIDLKQRIQEVNSELDKTKPGINSAIEAFHEFGMKTPQEFALVAEKQRLAFDEMVKSGQATKQQLSDSFKQWAENAIAANKGVSTAAIEAEAKQYGLIKVIDSTGKITFERAKDSVAANDRVTESLKRTASATGGIGDGIERSSARGINALNQLNQKLNETEERNRRISEQSAKESAERNENNKKSLGAIAQDYASYSTLTGMENFLKQAGLSQEKAMEKARELMEQYGSNGRMNWARANGIAEGMPMTTQQMLAFKSPSTYLLEIAERERYRKNGEIGQPSKSNEPVPVNIIPQPQNNQLYLTGQSQIPSKIDVNLRINGTLVRETSPNNYEADINTLLNNLDQARKMSGV